QKLGHVAAEVSNDRVREGNGLDPNERSVTRDDIDGDAIRIGSQRRRDGASRWACGDVRLGGRADVELAQRHSTRARNPELWVAEREYERVRYPDAMRDSTGDEVEDVDPSARIGDDRVVRPNESDSGPRQKDEIDWAPESAERAYAPVSAAVDLGDSAEARVCDQDAAGVDRRGDRARATWHRQRPQHLAGIGVKDGEAALSRQQDEAANRPASECIPGEGEHGDHGDEDWAH